MLSQEVSVDVWKMLKGMLTYAGLSLAGWVLIRLLSSIITMPRRMRAQQDRIHDMLEDFQRRYPDLKFTEEELRNAQKEIDEADAKFNPDFSSTSDDNKSEAAEEDKKSK